MAPPAGGRRCAPLSDTAIFEGDLLNAPGAVIVAQTGLRDVQAPSIGAEPSNATGKPHAKSRCNRQGSSLL